MSDNKNDDRKVIDLNVQPKSEVVDVTPADMKTAIAGTIALILFIMTGLNFSFFGEISENRLQSQRGVASLHRSQGSAVGSGISEINKDMVAEVARKPSAVDDLNYGDLEGRYALRIYQGQVTNIEFAENGEPKVFLDRLKFLERHAQVFAGDVLKIERVASRSESDGRFETYRMVGPKGETYVDVHLDSQSRLLSLDIK